MKKQRKITKRPMGRRSTRKGSAGRRGAARRNLGIKKRTSVPIIKKKKMTKTYAVLCARCGSSCKVPFKPTQGRPVYCKKCFRREK